MDDHRVGKKRTVMATFVKPKRNSGVASIKGASKKAENGDMYQKNSACDHAAGGSQSWISIVVALKSHIHASLVQDNNTASGSKDYLTWHYVFNLLIQILNGHPAMEDIASSTLTYLDKIDSEKSRPYLTLCPVQTFRPIHQLESTRLFLTQTLGDPNLEASAS
ncbi:hypothetical protein BU17DRAFT_72580 [Hysterangium stoloniferum]|nr:hypothetical protein BU17DRAFT_72580 [Hysterangium stoloniferum]